VGTTNRAGARKARGVWRSRGLYPDAAARVVSVAFQGEVKKALVELAPLRWDAGTGQLLLVRRLRVRLVFSGQETGERTLGAAAGPRSPHRTGRDPGNSDRLVTRLVTRARGLYAVGFEQLFAGQQRAVSASQLRLSRLGRDIAFHLEPNGPHFGPGARLYFLSEGAASSAYANGLREPGYSAAQMPVSARRAGSPSPPGTSSGRPTATISA
jgi:hypothetical protein